MENIRDLFGRPGEGLHRIRVLNAYIPGGIALVDLLATLILAYIISVYSKCNFIVTFIGLFIIGELLHLILGVKTAFIQYFV